MRSKIVVAVAIVGLVIVIGGYALYSFYLVPAWTVVTCPQYGCSPGGEQIIMEGYNFPVGGPLTVDLRNTGALSENLAGAHYFMCTEGASESCIPETFSGNCGTLVEPGAGCQATITVSGLVSASGYAFKLITPYGAIFRYSVFEGVNNQGATFNQGVSPTPDILMTGYNFPVGGPLTVTIKNIGAAPVNLTGATYWLGSYDYPVPLSGGNCSAAVMPGASCQAIVNVSAALSVPGMALVPGTSYKFSVELPSESFSEAFGFGVTYGASG